MLSAFGLMIFILGAGLLGMNYGHAWLGRPSPDGYDDGWRRGYRAGTRQIGWICKAVSLGGIFLFLIGMVLEAADTHSIGLQIGVVVIAFGAFLTMLGVISWVTLRLSGGSPTPRPTLRAWIIDNPLEVSMSLMARLVRIGPAVAVIGGIVCALSALISLAT